MKKETNQMLPWFYSNILQLSSPQQLLSPVIIIFHLTHAHNFFSHFRSWSSIYGFFLCFTAALLLCSLFSFSGYQVQLIIKCVRENATPPNHLVYGNAVICQFLCMPTLYLYVVRLRLWFVQTAAIIHDF